MSSMLNAGEVIGFAIYIEKNGYEFYTETAKKFNDEKLLKLFSLLAEEELSHECSFKALQPSAGPFTLPESFPGEYDAYMKEYLKTLAPKSNQSVQNLAARVETVKDALNMALALEKDSVVFYSALKTMVKKEHGEILDRIINEEIRHILQITHFANTEIPEGPDVDAL